MSELQNILDGLKEIINSYNQLQQNLNIIAFAAPIDTPSFPLVDAKIPLEESTTHEAPDQLVIDMLNKTINLLESFALLKIFLNQEKKRATHDHLTDFFLTLKILITTNQTKTITMKSGIALSGFLCMDGYSDIGELINGKFGSIIDIANRSQDALSQEITRFIEEYQKEVEPEYNRRQIASLEEKTRLQQQQIDTLRAENKQLSTKLGLNKPIPPTDKSNHVAPHNTNTFFQPQESRSIFGEALAALVARKNDASQLAYDDGTYYCENYGVQ